MTNKQYYTNEKLEEMALKLNEDLTLMEQTKLARNLIHLIHGDLYMQEENDEDLLTIASLDSIALSLDKIIKKYNVTPKMELDTILRKNFKLEEHPTTLQYQHSYALLVNLLYDLDKLGVLSDYQTIIDKLDKIEKGADR